MADFFASGRAADVVLLVLLAEAILLLVRGWGAGRVALLLLPAVLMIVALRAALTGAPWPLVALPLALSFPIHLADLARRRRD